MPSHSPSAIVETTHENARYAELPDSADHPTAAIVEAGPKQRPAGVQHESRSVGSWDLWVQSHPASHGYGAVIGISTKIYVDGTYCCSSLQLPLEAAYAVADLVNAVRAKLEAESAAQLSDDQYVGALADAASY